MEFILKVSLIIFCILQGHGNTQSLPSSMTLQDSTPCPVWHYYDVAKQSCQCLPIWLLTCEKNEAFIEAGHIVSYNENLKLISVVAYESYYQSWWKYNVTETGRILLPNNMSELNSFMCTPLNRRGYMCSKCADGYGPSLIGSTCTYSLCYHCTSDWMGVIKYLCWTFIPITVFYFIVVVFRLKMASAPTTCFVMYCQLIVLAFSAQCDEHLLSEIQHQRSGRMRTVTKIFLTLYGVFNLDFFHYAAPSFCISSKLEPIHIALLNYVSAFYPFLLIFLTYSFISLHDCNFRPIVILWKPFHKCTVNIRKWWNTKNDLADVFSTFFLLSYTKIMYQTLVLLNTTEVYQCLLSGCCSYNEYALSTDMSISVGSAKYVTITLIATLVFFIFNILPTLLLALYPTKLVKSVLSKCTPRMSITINLFVHKFHHCYRDGLDGGKDLRCFSGLYFLLRLSIVLVALALKGVFHFDDWCVRGIVFSLCAALVALCRPYKKMCANVLDTLLLLHLAGLCHMLSVGNELRYSVPLVQTMISLPLIVFTLIATSRFLFRSRSSAINLNCLKRKNLHNTSNMTSFYGAIN